MCFVTFCIFCYRYLSTTQVCIFCSKNASCYMAGSFTQAGAGVAVVGYELAPKGIVHS